MASILRQGAGWRAFVARRGIRKSAVFDTKGEAQAWAAGVENDILNGAKPVEKRQPDIITVASLFDRYADEVSPDKGGARWEAIRLRSLPAAFPIFAGQVSALDAPSLAAWRDTRLGTVAASTVNRELNLISAVLNHALKEWRTPGLVTNPVHAIKRPRDPAARTRRVTDAELALVVRQLGWDRKRQPAGAEQWIAWSFCLSVETAMRKGEILALTWQHVHLKELRLHLPKTKNGHARDVPLSPTALALFRPLVEGEGRVAPVLSGTFDVLFRRARDAANLPDLHFHDARREGTTRLATKLVNPLELAAATGHRDLNLLRRTYYQPNMTEIAKKLG